MGNYVYKKSIESITNKEVFFRVDYIQKIKEYSDTLNIVVLEGQRRVGKSYTLIGFLNYYHIDLDTVFYINKEFDITDEIRDQKDLHTLFLNIKQQNNIEYIIIDEIQNIEHWEKFILSLYTEKKYKIIITGSNSKLLSGELSTLITGRFLSINITPFSYKEFLQFTNQEKNQESFANYISYGGLPEVLLLENTELKKNYIQNTINSIFLKDIVSRFTIRNIKLLEKIFQFLQSEVGNIISLVNISHYITNIFKKEVSLTTISNYIKYLTYPYLVNEVSRYDIKGKKILDYTAKYYFSDIGIRNVSGFNFSNDIGKVLENLVYIKLISEGYQVFVGELNGKEVDFIAKKDGERLYIQVCYLLTGEKVIQREFGNLLAIKDNYEKIVVSMDESFGNTYDGIKIINILDFLTN